MHINKYTNLTQAPLAQRGFTIVELLIVIVVIAILAAISIVAYSGIQNRAEETKLRSDLSQAARQVEVHNATDGNYPSSGSETNDGQGLQHSNGTELTYSPSTDGYCISATSTTRDVGTFHVTRGGSIQDGECTIAAANITAGSPTNVSGQFRTPLNGSGFQASETIRVDVYRVNDRNDVRHQETVQAGSGGTFSVILGTNLGCGWSIEASGQSSGRSATHQGESIC